MDSLKQWVVTICSIVIFITAVEIVLPKNNMKKYVNFVFGLILIAAILNPIIRIFNSKFDVGAYSEKISNYLDNQNTQNDLKKYENKEQQSTLDVFKSNLEEVCKQKLKDQFPSYTYQVSAEVAYSKDHTEVLIKSLNIEVEKNGVESVKKVNINLDKDMSQQQNVDADTKSMKNFINNELKIPSDCIKVYKK